MPHLRPHARLLFFSTVLFVQLASGRPMLWAFLPGPQQGSAPSSTFEGDPQHPPQTSGWVETKLYFGLGPAYAPNVGVSEGKWREFLDKEVTPRFPAGLTVVPVYGQWQYKAHQGKRLRAPARIRSRLLILYHPATPENFTSIEAIRIAWKQITGDQSVLKVTQPVDVSF